MVVLGLPQVSSVAVSMWLSLSGPAFSSVNRRVGTPRSPSFSHLFQYFMELTFHKREPDISPQHFTLMSDSNWSVCSSHTH